MAIIRSEIQIVKDSLGNEIFTFKGSPFSWKVYQFLGTSIFYSGIKQSIINSSVVFFGIGIMMKQSVRSVFLVCLLNFTTIFAAIAQLNKGFVLIVPLYNETVPERIEEYKICIQKNLKHPLIHTIHVLYDTSKETPENSILRFLYDKKVKVSCWNGRQTYGDAFRLANAQYYGRTIILANADIYFDDSLLLIKDLDLTNIMFAITRWDVLEDGTSQQLKNEFYVSS